MPALPVGLSLDGGSLNTGNQRRREHRWHHYKWRKFLGPLEQTPSRGHFSAPVSRCVFQPAFPIHLSQFADDTQLLAADYERQPGPLPPMGDQIRSRLVRQTERPKIRGTANGIHEEKAPAPALPEV